MTSNDLAAVEAIAAVVHLSYPEHGEVFAERRQRYAPGCWVFAAENAPPLAYIISHPWLLLEPPPLDSLLGALPPEPDTYYIHDIALLPQARGSGAAGTIVQKLVTHARAIGMHRMSLIAVNASTPFWVRHAFEVHPAPSLADKLSSYDADAKLMIRLLD